MLDERGIRTTMSPQKDFDKQRRSDKGFVDGGEIQPGIGHGVELSDSR